MENVLPDEYQNQENIVVLNRKPSVIPTTSNNNARRRAQSGASASPSDNNSSFVSVHSNPSSYHHQKQNLQQIIKNPPLFLLPEDVQQQDDDDDDRDKEKAEELMNNTSDKKNNEANSGKEYEKKIVLRSLRLKRWIATHYNAVMLFSLFLIVISIALAAVGALHISGFIEHTTEILTPPPGTDAAIATQAFKDHMPHEAEVSYFNVFVTFNSRYFSPDGPASTAATTTPAGKNESLHYNITLIPSLCNFLLTLEKELGSNPKTKPHFQSMGDYCQLSKIKFNRIADHFISPDGTSVTAPIICNVSRFNAAAKTFGEGVEEIVDKITTSHLVNATSFNHANWTYVPSVAGGDFVIGVNGLSTFLTSIAKTSKKDLLAAMSVTMPILFVLIVLRLRCSFGFTVLLIAATGAHFCASFGAMRPLDNVMNVSSPTPLLMFCLGIGLSLMFGLLIVTDFAKKTRRYFDTLMIERMNKDEQEYSSPDHKGKIFVLQKAHHPSTSMRTRIDYIVTHQKFDQQEQQQNQQQRRSSDNSNNDETNDNKNNKNKTENAAANQQQQQVASILEQDINYDEDVLSEPSHIVHTQLTNLVHFIFQQQQKSLREEQEESLGSSLQNNNSNNQKRVSFAKPAPKIPTIPSSIEVRNLDHARCDILVDVIFSSTGAICIAALTLLCALCTTVFFPASIIQSLGIGCMVTVFCAWFYSCPVVLACLFVGFPFFVGCAYPAKFWFSFSACLRKTLMPHCLFGKGKCWECGVSCGDYAFSDDDDDEEGEEDNQQKNTDDKGPSQKRAFTDSDLQIESDKLLPSRDEYNDHDQNLTSAPNSPGNYSDMGRETLARELIGDDDKTHIEAATSSWLKKNAKLLIPTLLLTGFVIFYLVFTTRMTLSNSYLAYLGRHSPVTKDYISFVDAYGYGMTSPYRVLFTLKSNNETWVDPLAGNKTEPIETIFNPKFWDGSQEVVKRILNDPILGDQVHMAGPIVIGPDLQNLTTIINCLFHRDGCDDDSILAFLFQQVAKDDKSMYLMMTAKYDPLGEQGWSMYQRILELLKPDEASSSDETLNGNKRVFDVYLEGSGPSSLDCVHAIYARVPILAPLSVFIAMVVVFFCYHRSVLNALRFAYSLVASLSGPLGLAVLIYQNGGLNFLHIVIFESLGYIPWIFPIIVFAVNLGLVTAFDIIWMLTVCSPTVEGGIRFVSRSSKKQNENETTAVENNNNNNNNKSPLLKMEIHTRSRNNFHEAGSVYFFALIVFLALFGLALSDVPLMNAMGFGTCCAVVFAGLMIPQPLTIPLFERFSGLMRKY